jgi:cytidine deaminase
MFKEKGLEVKPEDFVPFIGTGEDRYLGGVAEKYNFPFNLNEDKTRTYAIYEEIASGILEPLNGVHEFIQKCKSRNLKIAVATSADEVKMKIKKQSVFIVKVSDWISYMQVYNYIFPFFTVQKTCQ